MDAKEISLFNIQLREKHFASPYIPCGHDT
jgi:hypothetical protein